MQLVLMLRSLYIESTIKTVMPHQTNFKFETPINGLL